MKKTLLRLLILVLLLALLPAVPFLARRAAPPAEQEDPGSSSTAGAVSAPSPAVTGEVLSLPAYYRVLDVSSDRVLRISPVEYLKGIAAAELPASYSRETVVAQMIAGHSYALTVMEENLADGGSAEISNDPAHHQGYLTKEERQALYGDNFPEREAALQEAAEEAVGWLLTSDGQTLLPAAYHGCSGGKTEDAENVWGAAVPCLTPVDSAADRQAPDFLRTFSFTAEEAAAILREKLPEGDFSGQPPDWLSIESTSPSGTVLSVKAGGLTCTGKEIRSWFSLPSAYFTLSGNKSGLVFATEGRGHGVGMSQYGAEQMALSGSGWQEILAHYYPGSVLIGTA